jgi:hypothetical protein
MKLDKKQLMVGASIVAIVGAYFVIKSLLGKKASSKGAAIDSNATNTSKETTPTKSVVPSNPNSIKKGDRDNGAPLMPKGKVVELQKLINQKGYSLPQDKFSGKKLIKLVEDGIFGTKTEQALQFWINKKSIDTQMDLNALKNAINPSIPQ